MQLTRIVVQAENDQSSDARVRTAATIAATYRAELVGVFADETADSVLAGVPHSRNVEALAAAELQTRRDDAAIRFRRTAAELLDEHFLLATSGDLVTGLLEASLIAELLVIGQDPGPDETGEGIATQIVLGAPCPVLVVPRNYAETFVARRILVGWKGTAPTARALAGALP